jgi:hypothetical protein
VLINHGCEPKQCALKQSDGVHVICLTFGCKLSHRTGLQQVPRRTQTSLATGSQAREQPHSMIAIRHQNVDPKQAPKRA